MKRPPFDPKKGVFGDGVGAQIIWIGCLMGAVSLVLGYSMWRIDPDGPWQTMVFTTLTISQMGNALAIRASRESLFSIGLFSNRLMVAAVVSTFALQLALVYLPAFQSVFKTEALTAQHLLISLVGSVIVFLMVEVYKWVLRRRDSRTAS
jgi:Ca2+-transporting ATPase